MWTIQRISQMIMEISRGSGNPIPNIELIIKGQINEVCLMLKNIRETSLNEQDKIHRLEKLSVDSGISYKTLYDLL